MGTHILARKPNLASKGSILERTPIPPALPPTEKAASFDASVPLPADVNAQSLPLALIAKPSPGASKINDLPPVPLE
jgi:hypothetical protein